MTGPPASDFIAYIRERAQQTLRRIVFPESGDPRVVEAVAFLARERIVHPIVIRNPVDQESIATARDLAVEAVDQDDARLRARTAERLLARRGGRGLTPAEAERLAATPLHLAVELVAEGAADGCVAGAVETTADVLRAALALVGTAPGISTVSSAFYMVVEPFRSPAAEVLTFTDCAVVPEPTAEQLADIAESAAHDRRRIIGDEPVVAFLSFSSHGSGAGETVTRVREAVERLTRRGCDFLADGELQGDAALVPSVAARKAPASRAAGRANVLVFPSLDAGNIAYKLVQRLGGAAAIGPIVQGLSRPCSDLSRGAVVDDIINAAAITALKAEQPFSQQRQPGRETES